MTVNSRHVACGRDAALDLAALRTPDPERGGAANGAPSWYHDRRSTEGCIGRKTWSGAGLQVLSLSGRIWPGSTSDVEASQQRQARARLPCRSPERAKSTRKGETARLRHSREDAHITNALSYGDAWSRPHAPSHAFTSSIHPLVHRD